MAAIYRYCFVYNVCKIIAFFNFQEIKEIFYHHGYTGGFQFPFIQRSVCLNVQVGQVLRRVTAGSGKKLSLELGGKSPVIIFESADLESTVEGVVDAIWFNQGQVCI